MEKISAEERLDLQNEWLRASTRMERMAECFAADDEDVPERVSRSHTSEIEHCQQQTRTMTSRDSYIDKHSEAYRTEAIFPQR